ncbi:MAG: trypsin-like peptidase domain-containing protein [Planctomycetes bacterium]|nr:trypsin-like peptidase domain-containing protein [Planctomycetota bacterium]MCW8136953.1 trypsin-like peptidase domain-containing protein [Planctomycetota bacterium]
MASLAELSSELEQLVTRSAPSVVSVEHRRGHGSGFVLAQDGYVLTNSHVVAGASELRIGFADGSHARAEVKGRDSRTDLAVVRADASSLPSMTLAGGDVRVGQLVLAIGNPLGFQRSVSMGVVSAIDRTLPGRGHTYEGLIQTDAAINPGNSGGPLINAHGEVVGVNTAIVPYAQGIGFAVPAQTAEWVAAILMRDGAVRRPVLGVYAAGTDLTTQQRREVGRDRAVHVFRLNVEGPAKAAGIREGDLLLEADGKPLRTVDDLSRAMVLTEGKELVITLWRDGQRVSLSITPQPAA